TSAITSSSTGLPTTIATSTRFLTSHWNRAIPTSPWALCCAACATTTSLWVSCASSWMAARRRRRAHQPGKAAGCFGTSDKEKSMKRIPQMMLLAVLALLPAAAAAQASPMTRDQVRERVRDSLNRYGTRSDVNATFRQSTKEPYNFVGTMTGLKNIDSLEIVVSVTKSDTIGFRIYPHYNGGYINLDKARDSTGLMRKLLYYTDQNFLFL